MLVRFAIPAALLLLNACAAAMPGYSPPPFKEHGKAMKPMESGDVDADGRYEMSDTEKAMDCKRITGSMQITISRLKDSYVKAEPTPGSRAAQTTMAPVLSGSTVGADRQALVARERAKLDAYNRELQAKGCKQLDIDTELARAPEAPGKRY